MDGGMILKLYGDGLKARMFNTDLIIIIIFNGRYINSSIFFRHEFKEHIL